MTQGVGATGGVAVDPELLKARLESVSDEAVREEVYTIIECAVESLRRVHEVPISALESGVAGHTAMALWSAVDDGVSAAWLSLEDLQAGMQPLIDAYEAQSGSEGGGLYDDHVPEEEAPAEETTDPSAPTLVLDGVTKRIGETVWAMSFVLTSELKEFRRRLQGLLKLKDGWGLLDALSSHLKHLRSTVNAILGGVYASLAGVTGESSADDQTFELTSSRELRSQVFELRDDIGATEKRLASTPPGEWRDLLRHTRDLVDHFIFSPGFAWTRAMDKRSFLE
ncbi:MAG: hypothetical protein V3T05_06620, partial [Myxococcota bacterium]